VGVAVPATRCAGADILASRRTTKAERKLKGIDEPPLTGEEVETKMGNQARSWVTTKSMPGRERASGSPLEMKGRQPSRRRSTLKRQIRLQGPQQNQKRGRGGGGRKFAYMGGNERRQLICRLKIPWACKRITREGGGGVRKNHKN